MSPFFYLIGLVVFLEAFRRVQTAYRLSKIELRPEPKTLIPLSEIPDYEMRILAAPRVELEALGFVLSHAERLERRENGIDCPVRELVFALPGKALRATLSASVLPDAFRSYCVTFSTRDRHGQTFRSVDAPGFFHFLRGSKLKIASLYCLNVNEHRVQHENWAGEAESSELDAGASFREENALLTAWLAEQKQSGRLAENDGWLRMPVRSTWAAAQKLLAAMQECGHAQSLGSKSGRLPVHEVPLEAEAAAYEQVVKVQGGQTMKRAAKLVLFALTALLFLASFGLTLSWHSVLILLVVIFFHELGHVVAMRAYGFQDLKILFLPFLGAVAMGRRKSTSTLQKVVVALAGPLPGLILGLVCFWGVSKFDLQGNALLSEFAWTLLGINFFNLLPILPLDGGQVVHALIFCRFPLLEALFGIAGGLVLGAAGYFTGEPVLAFLALLILVSTKDQVRRSRLLAGLRRTLREKKENVAGPELTKVVFSHLSANGCEKFPFARRFQLADYLMTNVQAPGAGGLQTGILFTFYLLTLALAPAVLVFLALNSADAESRKDFFSESWKRPGRSAETPAPYFPERTFRT